jgi:hypothetical protein
MFNFQSQILKFAGKKTTFLKLLRQRFTQLYCQLPICLFLIHDSNKNLISVIRKPTKMEVIRVKHFILFSLLLLRAASSYSIKVLQFDPKFGSEDYDNDLVAIIAMLTVP